VTASTGKVAHIAKIRKTPPSLTKRREGGEERERAEEREEEEGRERKTTL
jgi:hypothetical protein